MLERIHIASMLEITDWHEAIEYAETHWKSFFDSQPKDLINNVLSIKSSGRKISNSGDREVIEAINKMMAIIPPFEEDVVLYRGGKESDFNGDRPFLSSSFLKATGESFNEKPDSKLYKIRVYKGSRAIPTCGMGIQGCEVEQGVILETKFIHRNGTECDYFEECGYYKLYLLKEEKLYSYMMSNNPISINEAYSSMHETSQLCFATLGSILNYMDKHGTVVCDVIPLDTVRNSTPGSIPYSECKTIIPHFPRSIYSPSFVEELINHSGNEMLWIKTINEEFIKGAIEHFRDGKCYWYSLDFDLSETLSLLLLKNHFVDKEKNKFLLNQTRKELDYSAIYKFAKQRQADRKALAIIVQAWNNYSPCITSRLLSLICSIISQSN